MCYSGTGNIICVLFIGGPIHKTGALILLFNDVTMEMVESRSIAAISYLV